MHLYPFFCLCEQICDLPKNTTATNSMKIGNVREISQRRRKNKDGNSCEKFIFAKGEREKHHQVASSSSQTLTEWGKNTTRHVKQAKNKRNKRIERSDERKNKRMKEKTRHSTLWLIQIHIQLTEGEIFVCDSLLFGRSVKFSLIYMLYIVYIIDVWLQYKYMWDRQYLYLFIFFAVLCPRAGS